MKTLGKLKLARIVSVAMLATMVSSPQSVFGQDVLNTAAASTPEAETSVATPGEIPEELRDFAFDRYVDLDDIGRAWGRLDASAMADIALQLREAERVLLRSHKAINGAKVMALTLNLAVKNQDQETLARLAIAAKNSGDQDLSQRIAAATKIAAATRSTEPPLLVSVGETTVEGFIETQDLMKQLDSARVAEDAAGIKKAIESIVDSIYLSEKQREQLIQLATQAKSGIAPLEGDDGDSTVDALNKLAGPSRGSQDYYYNILFKGGSRKSIYFATYREAFGSWEINTKVFRCSEIVGPPTLFVLPKDLVFKAPLPSGLHFVRGTNNSFVTDLPIGPAQLAGNAPPLSAAIEDAKQVEVVKAMAKDGRMVAAGGGNVKPTYSVKSTSGVVRLGYR